MEAACKRQWVVSSTVSPARSGRGVTLVAQELDHATHQRADGLRRGAGRVRLCGETGRFRGIAIRRREAGAEPPELHVDLPGPERARHLGVARPALR